MSKQVVARRSDDVVTLDELSNNKGYVMRGIKGDYIIARDTDGNFIWVRLIPTKNTSKPVHAYATLKEAIKDKIDNGFDVFEYDTVEVM